MTLAQRPGQGPNRAFANRQSDSWGKTETIAATLPFRKTKKGNEVEPDAVLGLLEACGAPAVTYLHLWMAINPRPDRHQRCL